MFPGFSKKLMVRSFSPFWRHFCRERAFLPSKTVLCSGQKLRLGADFLQCRLQDGFVGPIKRWFDSLTWPEGRREGVFPRHEIAITAEDRQVTAEPHLSPMWQQSKQECIGRSVAV